MRKLLAVSLILSTMIMESCCNSDNGIELIAPQAFDTIVDGNKVSLYTLQRAGLTMQVTNYGARVVSLWVPDRDGKYEDVVLGYQSIARYLDGKGERFLGAVVGRYANRIAAGRFTLDGKEYQLPQNSNGQMLHGGTKGLDGVVWQVMEHNKDQIKMRYVSPDGEEGFAGELTIDMTYRLTETAEFEIIYDATTDAPTVVNISHHSFFNLTGAGNSSILGHELTINASAITPVDSNLIPTGEIMAVDGTPLDFRTPCAIGERIGADNEQLKAGSGYDHNWIVDRSSDGVELAATLYEPVSGRVMEVWSDQPAIQFYSGNFFNGSDTGKYGKRHEYRASVALETQKYPDSPNHPTFPSTRLDPQKHYKHICRYKFYSK